MEIFKIEIQKILSKTIEIEAVSIQDAFTTAKDLYKKEEIVLDNGDFVKVEFIDSNIQDYDEEKNILIKDVIDYLCKDEEKYFKEYETEPENHIFLKLKRLKSLIEQP